MTKFRVRTPTVMQMEAVECGAASLAMVLAYHGAFIPLEELRVSCGVTRDGTKASNLLKAAKRYGMSTRAFKKEPGSLKSLPMPSIVHWNFNHFLVLEGFNGDKVYLNDPASGPRVVSIEEFGESFTGVVIAMEPGENFEKRGREGGLLVSLSALLGGAGKALAFVMMASLALVIPGIAIAGFARIFVDQILMAGKEDWLIPLVLGIVITAIFRTSLTWLQQKYLLRLETGLAVSMASTFLWRMVHLPLAFFSQRHVGDLADRMAANDRVATLLSGQLATNVMNLASVIFYALAIAVFDPAIALIATFLAATNLLAIRAVNRSRQDASRMLLVSGGKLAAATVSSIRTAETLKASGIESDAFTKWAGYQAKMLESQKRLGFSAALLTAFPALMSSLSVAAVLGVGGLRIIEGTLSVGELVAIQSLMASFTLPIASLVNLGGQIQKIRGDLTRLDDVSAHTVSPPRGPAAGSTWQGPPVLSGKLDVSNTIFGYSPLDRPMLDGVSLELTPGCRIAIVGGSGSGKSTLGRMIAGMLPPWEGEIRFDGYSVDEIPPEVFASSVAYVDQDIFLFAGTIRDNLTLWDENIPEQAITQALKDASIHDEVMGRQGQYDSLVEEGGINFSGGQRQRLEIARALVCNPTLLILDEATAALDPVTEKKIDDNLRRRGCACLIIAHRLSTVRDSDEIIVLERGRIVERGRHEELLAMDGEYARLIGKDG